MHLGLLPLEQAQQEDLLAGLLEHLPGPPLEPRPELPLEDLQECLLERPPQLPLEDLPVLLVRLPAGKSLRKPDHCLEISLVRAGCEYDYSSLKVIMRSPGADT